MEGKQGRISRQTSTERSPLGFGYLIKINPTFVTMENRDTKNYVTFPKQSKQEFRQSFPEQTIDEE